MWEADKDGWNFTSSFCVKKHFGLPSIIDMQPGRKYSNTEFDAFHEISWDVRGHRSQIQLAYGMGLSVAISNTTGYVVLSQIGAEAIASHDK